ncbi:endonuclease [Dokdonia sinensis]|uniref:Endonuclease n=1 Tax=Dokdonia sinensis TaxID=2479847 RepID=A0A3M0H2V5_9FLAO|nr:endonuclease/exonuclease/phosphatase family protein [Dokdonia sinensis]RMB63986.1 endonuclease [Dokdonia sinensis]
MKKLGLFGKLLFFINSLFVILLLLGYFLPYIPPHVFPRLAVLSLVLPVLLFINALFFGYWLFRMRRQLLLSAIVLVFGIGHITALFRFGSNEDNVRDSDLKVMSFNVHSFTRFGKTPRRELEPEIKAFIAQENPDVISFQEYNPSLQWMQEYEHQYVHMTNRKETFGQIIYSKFPIVHSGSLGFGNTGNNGIFVDIVKDLDTLRVYNLHFQSFRINANFSQLQREDSKRLLGRMAEAFEKQEDQMELFLSHEAQCPYPIIVTGDFNNSATSYVYRKVKGEKVDAFAKAGSGTGRTFTFDFLPLRIDFILADEKLEVVNFKNYDVQLSDHYPIMAVLRNTKEL